MWAVSTNTIYGRLGNFELVFADYLVCRFRWIAALIDYKAFSTRCNLWFSSSSSYSPIGWWIFDKIGNYGMRSLNIGSNLTYWIIALLIAEDFFFSVSLSDLPRGMVKLFGFSYIMQLYKKFRKYISSCKHCIYNYGSV